MHLKVVRSKNAASYYVLESTYDDGKSSSRVFEKLGTEAHLREKLNGEDPYSWALSYVNELNKNNKSKKQTEVMIKYSTTKKIPLGEKRSFNGGYLFLQCLYYALGLPELCKSLKERHSFEFDLNSIFSRLIYTRILSPSSKLGTHRLSHDFLEAPKFELHQIYRALEVLAAESDLIQSSLYENSKKLIKRHTGVVYYDCTNFFFEIEQESGNKRYGFSKEHRPNPIVQMGLFMDSDGIPLAFSINPGNTNEQVTLQPLEQKLISDFKLSKFVVCTDAGLASAANRKFNDVKNRAYITTKSVKKDKKYIKEWMLAEDKWSIAGEHGAGGYNIGEILQDDTLYQQFFDKIFYKERWVKEDGMEQRIIVTWSLKYLDYQRKIRNRQIESAVKTINHNPGKLDKCNQNDYKRFIKKEHITKDGTKATEQKLSINDNIVADEERYDGFYAVCTNLEDDIQAITKIVRSRWEIEECFRIMKSEFEARPVYLRRDERINAHFLTCFVSLMIYRLLEKKLNNNFTCSEILDTLKTMRFIKKKREGYEPAYVRTLLTDVLHDRFGFHTEYEIILLKTMREIFKFTKKG